MSQKRWANYYLDQNFAVFWQQRLADPAAKACIILGAGFDSRSLVAFEALQACSQPGQIADMVLRLSYSNHPSPQAQRLNQLTGDNWKRLEVLPDRNCLGEATVEFQSAGIVSNAVPVGRQVIQFVNGLLPQLSGFQDIIVDISGMPRSFFFPLIKFLCQRSEVRNLHVVVVEDTATDGQIQGREFGPANFIDHFRPRDPQSQFVWMPVIGKHEPERLNKIHTQIGNQCIEICPILPFPGRNLRRADELLVHLHESFEAMNVAKENIMLCDEQTPFDIYRKIVDLVDYHDTHLKNLPGLANLETVVSPLANKMLSLGALLAAIECNLPVSYVEAGSYVLEDLSPISETVLTQITEVWLTGEPYEPLNS